MSVRIVPWTKRGKKGWEVDIRITWPDDDEDRERLKAPVSGRDAAERWRCLHSFKADRSRGVQGIGFGFVACAIACSSFAGDYLGRLREGTTESLPGDELALPE